MNYPMRFRLIKSEFTSRYLAAGGTEGSRSASRRKRQERGIWQCRYWKHTIDDEVDFERRVEYIHYNAVKHEWVQCPKDWQHSSFHPFVENGIYDEDWGCVLKGELCFDDLDETAMEQEQRRGRMLRFRCGFLEM